MEFWNVPRFVAIKNVLEHFGPSDLAARFRPGLEVHVAVAQGAGQVANDENGKPLTGVFRDEEGDRWHSYRNPKQEGEKFIDGGAWTQSFRLDKHFDSIGITGWDFVNSKSVGVGFDFDSVAGHAEGVGVSLEKLEAVKQRARELPYVEVRRSTSGNGLHLWVWFHSDNLPETANRAEHAALARAVLAKMSFDVGYPFQGDVDVFGKVLWICARRATPENLGLTLIKAAAEPLREYPANWREHLPVVQNKQKRTRFLGPTTNEEQGKGAHLAQNYPRFELDEGHRAFIASYELAGFGGNWNEDHGCYAVHTKGVEKVHLELKLRGVYRTTSLGNDPSTPNAFMFPLPHGVWQVFRFGTPKEAPNWSTSASGWTTCRINTLPTLGEVAKMCDGKAVPNRKSETYLFIDPCKATEALAMLGAELALPEWALQITPPRPIELQRDDAMGGVNAKFDRDNAADTGERAHHAQLAGWLAERGPTWVKHIEVELASHVDPTASEVDPLVRFVSRQGEQLGLFANTKTGWQKQNVDRVKDFLKFHGIGFKQQPFVLGWCGTNTFEDVAVPFEDEFPGDRRWNKRGARLLYSPSESIGETPHWDTMLHHVGRGLDEAVEANEFCRDCGISNGAGYLRAWIANLVRCPERRLPMLALYCSMQNTGKSSLWEGIKELFDDRGFTYGMGALTNKSSFNGELEGKVLVVLEEQNLADTPLAYNRLKLLVTNREAQYEHKGKTVYAGTNYTHWIATTNARHYIPIEPGDTRIMIWEVTPFEGKEIKKQELLSGFRKEAPFFMRQLHDLDISNTDGRLTMPVLMTKEKNLAEREAGGRKEPPKVDGDAQKLLDAIVAVRPSFSGTASDLCELLGNWDSSSRSSKSRAMTTGRYMKQLQPQLAEAGITLKITSGKTTLYSLSV